MIKIFGIPNCNKMKLAFDTLKESGLPYQFHDYKKMGLSMEILDEILSKTSLEALINKKGTTYKALSEADKAALEKIETAKGVIIDKPSMIKRPLLLRENGELSYEV